MGRTVRKTPSKVNTKELYQISMDIMDRYKNITLAIDIMYFDRIPFLLMISRDVHFYTAEKITNRENKIIMECLRKMLAMYDIRGFTIQFILGDGEFRHMIGDIVKDLKCHLNCTVAGEHVPEAERAIRVIKERARCVTSTWPFDEVLTLFKI